MQTEIYKKLAHILSFICNNPLIFVSETDIHVLVMSELMKINSLDPLKRLYKTQVSLGKNKKGKISANKYSTMLIHKEYGNNANIKERSDIVIFDRVGASTISDPINLKDNRKYLTPKYIFEFGTEKSAGVLKTYKEHIEKDFNKLLKSKDKGFLIHIQRRFVRATRQTRRFIKNQLKSQDYENATVKFFKEHQGNKVIPLIFYVEIGVHERNIGSKVKIFDPYENKWKRINLKSIENEIIRILTEGDKSGN